MALVLLGCALVVALPGCTGGDAASATGADSGAAGVGGAAVAAPIPLREALDRKICELVWVKDVPFSSRYMRFVLKPLTGEQETVVVEPGWMLTAKGRKGSALTVLPATGRLLAKNNASIDVLSAEIEHCSYASTEYEPARLAGGELAALLATSAAQDPPPSWNELQAAVWILTRDELDLRRLRKERYSAPQVNDAVIVLGAGGGFVVPEAGTLDRAFALLAAAGLGGRGQAIRAEAEQVLGDALVAYRANDKPLQALDRLGFYRTRPDAFAILTAAFERHAAEPVYLRKAAMRGLAAGLIDRDVDPPRVDAELYEVFRAARDAETDDELRRDLDRWLGYADRARGGP